jgi:hypothetical protein
VIGACSAKEVEKKTTMNFDPSLTLRSRYLVEDSNPARMHLLQEAFKVHAPTKKDAARLIGNKKQH